MKILLIGPYPPPHGGISVHVIEARKRLERVGEQVQVLNTNRGALSNPEYLSFRTLPGLIALLFRYSLKGWMFHVHTNGHNTKSWLLALLCGLIGKLSRVPSQLLTVHSGMAPAHLRGGGGGAGPNRLIARSACKLFDRIVAVNSDIFDALSSLRIPASNLEVLPAYLFTSSSAAIPATVESFLQTHWPIFSSVLFFRPEYGVDFLLKSLSKLRETHPQLGCLLLGSGERSIEARMTILKEGIGESVLLLGDVSHELCLALMSRSHAFFRCTLADGDSISVREALDLRVPVVASAVGCRPAGVLLFPPGDESAFITQVKSALERERPQEALASQDTSIPQLIQMYRKLQPGNLGS